MAVTPAGALPTGSVAQAGITLKVTGGGLAHGGGGFGRGGARGSGLGGVLPTGRVRRGQRPRLGVLVLIRVIAGFKSSI